MAAGARIAKLGLLVLSGAAAVGFVVARPPIPQPETYHAFADTRTLERIPHAANVLSNVFFALVGLAGLRFLARGPTLNPEASYRPGAHTAFESYRERPAYVLFFTGIFLTAFGSAYYHLAPSTTRLFWDRLPMALAFMALFSTVIAERLSVYWSRNLLLPLLSVGIASVVAWRLSEQRSEGDLRAYVLVQGLPLLLIPAMMVLFRSRYTHGWMLLLVILLYGGAKVLEQYDTNVFAATGGRVSGHSLKHVVSALAVYVVVSMLKRRSLALDKPKPPYLLREEDEEDDGGVDPE